MSCPPGPLETRGIRTSSPGANRVGQGTVIASFRYRHEAETAAGFLEHRQIVAAVFADDAGGSYPAMNSAGARLVVSEADVERALEILVNAGMVAE